MARLPQPGGDEGNWGVVLNDYLSSSHNNDGTIKNGSVGAAQLAANSVTSTALAPNAVTVSEIQDGTITEVKLAGAVQTKLNSGGSVSDATTTAKGIVQLAGDLGGTSASPTVTKTYTKADVGLANVNNTSDASKPISTATQAALDTKLSSSVLNAALQNTDAIARYSGGAYPTRSSVTTDTSRSVRWRGPSAPAIGGSGAISGLDVWEQTA